jgi:hypothetical protein
MSGQKEEYFELAGNAHCPAAELQSSDEMNNAQYHNKQFLSSKV